VLRKIVGLEWSKTLASRFSASLRVQPQREGFQPFPPYKKDAPLLAAGRF
jgi:hypothetical protein